MITSRLLLVPASFWSVAFLLEVVAASEVSAHFIFYEVSQKSESSVLLDCPWTFLLLGSWWQHGWSW